MRAPSLVAQLYTSIALPLLRFTSTYHALVSTVAANADVAAIVMSMRLMSNAIANDFIRAREMPRRPDAILTSMCIPLLGHRDRDAPSLGHAAWPVRWPPICARELSPSLATRVNK